MITADQKLEHQYFYIFILCHRNIIMITRTDGSGMPLLFYDFPRGCWFISIHM